MSSLDKRILASLSLCWDGKGESMLYFLSVITSLVIPNTICHLPWLRIFEGQVSFRHRAFACIVPLFLCLVNSYSSFISQIKLTQRSLLWPGEDKSTFYIFYVSVSSSAQGPSQFIMIFLMYICCIFFHQTKSSRHVGTICIKVESCRISSVFGM